MFKNLHIFKYLFIGQFKTNVNINFEKKCVKVFFAQ